MGSPKTLFIQARHILKMKLKTLKDLAKEHDDLDGFNPDCNFSIERMFKEEAINWIKHYKREIQAQINFIKHFFNLTEEDLK